MRKIGWVIAFSALLSVSSAQAAGIPVRDMIMVGIKTMRQLTEVERAVKYAEQWMKKAEELAKQNEYLGPIIKEIPAMKELGKDIKKLSDDVNGTKRFFEDLADNGFIPQEFRGLVAFPTDVSKSVLKQSEQKDSEMTEEGVLFRAFPTHAEAIEYVRSTFFTPTAQQLTPLRAQDLSQKRLQIQKEVYAENYAYAQTVKTDGQEDFVKRMGQLAEENKPKEGGKAASKEEAKEAGVASEAKAWAVNTLALRNAVQETMVRVVLEQRLLEQEAVNALAEQEVVLMQDPTKKATKGKEK